MRFIIPSIVALVTSAAGMKVSVGTKCLDITKDIPITWDKDGDDRVPAKLTFSLWNKRIAYPNVDDSFPIGDPTPLQVDWFLNKTNLPHVSAEKAQTYINNHQGRLFEIRVNEPETYTDTFTIATPGGGCEGRES